MNLFFVENLSQKEDYHTFINYMISHSDYFSFVYFKYREGEKTKKSVKEIALSLKPYKKHSKMVNQWASTVSLNENNHIYRLIIYASHTGAKDVLNRVDSIFDWDYPRYPMDLCFYKNGYAWFASSAHEFCNWLYIDENDQHTILDLTNMGVNTIFRKPVDKSHLFQLVDFD